MVEEIYLLIYVLFIIGLLVCDFLEPIMHDQSVSELRACHRYAVADRIMRQPSHCESGW